MEDFSNENHSEIRKRSSPAAWDKILECEEVGDGRIHQWRAKALHDKARAGLSVDTKILHSTFKLQWFVMDFVVTRTQNTQGPRLGISWSGIPSRVDRVLSTLIVASSAKRNVAQRKTQVLKFGSTYMHGDMYLITVVSKARSE